MSQIDALNCIHSSRSISWERHITGPFAKDKWHLPYMVEKYPHISKKNIYFDYIQNPFIKAEIKYFFMYKLVSKEYSPASIAQGFCQSSRHLCNFFNEYNYKINSVLELDLEKTLVLLRTWLSEKGYSQYDRAPVLLKAMYSFYLHWYDTRDEYEKDIWDLRRMYPESEHPKYVGNRAWYMNFTFINNPRLKILVKGFFKVRVATRALQTVHKELRYLRHFIRFLQEKDPQIDSFSFLERHHMEEFYLWLASHKNQYGELTSLREKRYTVQYLRIVFEYLQRVGNKDAPKKPLIYPEDACGTIKRIPRFIPQTVFEQLKDNLYLLMPHIRNAVVIVMNVGMRASEVLTLKEDCIFYDKDGSAWIRYYMHKMHKEHHVPTSREVVDAVNSQLLIAAEIPDPRRERYLFRTRKGLLQYQRVTSELRKLSKMVPITDPSGSIYFFSFHQFRHTVGTSMINAGVPVTSVQKYLGHESPEMTMVYAHIHDQTLKKDFEKVIKDRLLGNYAFYDRIDSTTQNEVISEMEWFKHNLYKNALPNGYCLHHPKQGGCPHANVCLTCPKFTTSKTFIPVLSQQLEMTKKLVEDAKNRGWDREAEHQTNIALRLSEILSGLECHS
jgi:integrase